MVVLKLGSIVFKLFPLHCRAPTFETVLHHTTDSQAHVSQLHLEASLASQKTPNITTNPLTITQQRHTQLRQQIQQLRAPYRRKEAKKYPQDQGNHQICH